MGSDPLKTSAAGPLLAGVLLELSADQDFRPAFAIIAALLVAAALAFRWGVAPEYERMGPK